MEKIVEDPSAVLLEQNSFSQVVFNNVEKFYIPGKDVTCYYTFTQQLIPRPKDWIDIFKVGWKTTREYYTFMWVALPSDLSKESTKQQGVHFKAYYLPKDDEYYQFCYVDQDGVVQGASIPFQFRLETEEDIVVITTKGRVKEMEQQNEQLLQENQQLKDSCANLQKQNSDGQVELQRKQEMLEALQSTTRKLEQQVEEQKACWETDQLQLKEDNQKMSSENKKMGLRVDQLLGRVEEMEQQNEQLLQENQQLKDSCANLQKQNSDGQVELQRKQGRVEEMEQQNEQLL
ncbi:calcium-binding and coiled-coil domain-containing protein 2 isoform X1 [Sigmodon hispidus]